jgi:hypothetical protein
MNGWVLQGKVLLDLKRPREALTSLEKAWQIAPEDDRVQTPYCKALFAEGLYGRSLAELPVEVVAHGIFHVFLRLASRGHNKEQIVNTLLMFHSIFAEGQGPDALAGALIEFTSHLHRHARPDEIPELRRWYEVISWLFFLDPRFEMLIKVFDVMLRYKESQDEKVLLELPLEQRQLLQSPKLVPKKTPAPEPAALTSVPRTSSLDIGSSSSGSRL